MIGFHSEVSCLYKTTERVQCAADRYGRRAGVLPRPTENYQLRPEAGIITPGYQVTLLVELSLTHNTLSTFIFFLMRFPTRLAFTRMDDMIQDLFSTLVQMTRRTSSLGINSLVHLKHHLQYKAFRCANTSDTFFLFSLSIFTLDTYYFLFNLPYILFFPSSDM